MKALEKDRSRRYGSAEEMATDISRYFNQLPIVARPPSAVYRARKLLRRRRGPIVTAAVMVLALSLEFAYAGWQRSQAASEAALASSTATSTTTDARQVWTWPELSFSGSISPDGRYLALSNAGPNLRVHDFVTGEDRDITRDSNSDMSSWSPDGTQLAYTSYCDRSLECIAPRGSGSIYELRITDLEGVDSRLLYRGDDDEVWYPAPGAWSPDGQQVLVSLDGGQLVLMSVSDGSLRELKSFDRKTESGGLFSPDGAYVAYSYSPDETSRNRDIFLISVDGSREVQLTETPADESVLSWAPDGTLLFRSERNGDHALFKIGVENGTPAGPAVMLRSDLGNLAYVLGTTRDGALYYAVRPDMSPLAYTAAFDPETVEVIGPPKRVAPTFPAFAADPVWSPGGEHLAYWSERGADQLLVVRDLQSARETVTAIDAGPRLSMEWHPDGGSLMVAARPGGWDAGVYQVDITEGAIPRLVPYEERGWVGQHGTAYRLEMDCGRAESQLFQSVNARTRCAWRRNSLVRAAIMKKDHGTGLQSELYRLTPGDVEPWWALSPDGREIVVQAGTADAPVLEVVSTTSGVARHLTGLTYRGQPVRPREGLTWTPDGRNIVFFGSRGTDANQTALTRLTDPGPVRLYRVAATGGDLEPAGLETSGLERGLGSLFGPRRAVFGPDGREIRFLASQPPVDEEGRAWGWTVWALDNVLPTAGEGD